MKKIVMSVTAVLLVAVYYQNSDLKPATPASRTEKPWWKPSSGAPAAPAAGRPVLAARPQARSVTEAAARLRDLSQKVIRGPADEAEWESLLASPESLDRAELRIVGSRGDIPLAQDQKERMDAVLVFTHALQWKRNPAHAQVIERVKRLILDRQLAGVQSMDIKRSLVADRMEMYVVLRENFPEDADRVDRLATEPLQRKFIEFANNFYGLKKPGVSL